MDRSQIRVFEQRHKVSLRRLLQRHHSRRLEPKVRLEVLRDLAHKTLERQLPDQKLRRLLVPTDLSQSDRTGAEPVRLLHTTSCLRTKLEDSRREDNEENAYGRLLASCRRLGGELLPRGLATGRFTSRLLRACHL